MTLSEKLGLVNLANANGYENQDTAVPRLCIPALTLQDSPNGLANGAKQVTQLPASLGIAASAFRSPCPRLRSRSLGPTGPRTVQFEPQGKHGTDPDDLGRLIEQAGGDVIFTHDGETPVV